MSVLRESVDEDSLISNSTDERMAMRQSALIHSVLLSLVCCWFGEIVVAADHVEQPIADAQRPVNVNDQVRAIQMLEISLDQQEEILEIKRDELSIFVEAAGTDDAAKLDLAQEELTEQCEQLSLEIAKVQTLVGETKSRLAALDDAGATAKLDDVKVEGAKRSKGSEAGLKRFLSRKIEILNQRESRLAQEVDNLKAQIRRLEYRSFQIQELQRQIDIRYEDVFETRMKIKRATADLNSGR